MAPLGRGTPPPLSLSTPGVDATFVLLIFVLVSALIAAGAALACFIRWVPPPHKVPWGSRETSGSPMWAPQQLPCPLPAGVASSRPS